MPTHARTSTTEVHPHLFCMTATEHIGLVCVGVKNEGLRVEGKTKSKMKKIMRLAFISYSFSMPPARYFFPLLGSHICVQCMRMYIFRQSLQTGQLSDLPSASFVPHSLIWTLKRERIKKPFLLSFLACLASVMLAWCSRHFSHPVVLPRAT